MTIREAIQARHSVRTYIDKPLSEDAVAILKSRIEEVNAAAGLHVQLVLNEPKSFKCAMAKYGHFSGVPNYLVMAGKKTDDLDEKVGYISLGYGANQGVSHKIKSVKEVSRNSSLNIPLE